jgi:pimeloyl-ACP methyl ester carboxylesterase
MDAMTETIRIDDLTVDCARPPHATRPPVLFVHGYFASAAVFTEWLAFFAARGAPAYAVNLRGRAGSRPGVDVGRISIDDFANDASAVARHLGSPIVVGHSMGGLIAQRLAELGDVRAAVLVSPAPPRGITVLSPRLAIKQLKYLPAILGSRPVVPSREDLREIVLNRIPHALQDVILDQMVPDSGRAGREMSITGVPIDRLKVRCPILVVGAEDDRFIPKGIAERVARRYTAPVEIFPEHAHMSVVEPGWEVIADFVDRWIGEHS